MGTVHPGVLQLNENHRCSVDNVIVPELTYNPANNLAYSEVNVFKFADKVYFKVIFLIIPVIIPGHHLLPVRRVHLYDRRGHVQRKDGKDYTESSQIGSPELTIRAMHSSLSP